MLAVQLAFLSAVLSAGPSADLWVVLSVALSVVQLD